MVTLDRDRYDTALAPPRTRSRLCRAKLRFSITPKVAVGVAVIIAIGMISKLMIYRGLVEVERALDQLASVRAPLSAAAYELELNVNGMGLATPKYLATRRPVYRSWAEDDGQDFAHFHTEYLRLARTAPERDPALRVGELHREFASLAHMLMSYADEQERLYAVIIKHARHIDFIIDARLQPGLFAGHEGRPGDFGAAVATADLEAETAEVTSAVANYHRLSTPKARGTIIARLNVLDRTLANLTNSHLTEEGRRHLPAPRVVTTEIAESIKTVIANEDAIHRERQRFVDLRALMDRLLDDEVQPLVLRGMDEPRALAKAAADRVRPAANDEFGDLAVQHNRMVEQLQATTVSRQRLEASEIELEPTTCGLPDCYS